MSWSTLLTLNGTSITNHNRKFDEKVAERATEVQLASGHTRKYVKFIGHEWTLSWDWLPDNTSTADGAPGRDGLKAMVDGGAKTLVVYSLGGGSNTYNVFISDYSETLLRRFPVSGRSYWTVSMTLKEV